MNKITCFKNNKFFHLFAVRDDVAPRTAHDVWIRIWCLIVFQNFFSYVHNIIPEQLLSCDFGLVFIHFIYSQV